MNRFAALDIEEFVPEPSRIGPTGPTGFTGAEVVGATGSAGLFEELVMQYVISQGSSMRTDHVWRCKDGSTLFVSEMSDTHLLNSARLLMRKKGEDLSVRFSLDVLRHEANRRGRLL